MNDSTLNKPGTENMFRDSVPTIDQHGKRVWLFPHQPHGKFYTARTWVSICYLIIFFTLPFLKYNGHPLFLANVLERRFILFGQIFWPQDFFIFGIGMIVFIVFVALFTVVFGRIFCGWACPQTIFMEMVFRKIEYLIEGDAAEQRLLKKAPWNTDKILRKSAKIIAFWTVSFLIANTFLAYVIGIDALKKIASEPLSQHLGSFVSLAVFTTVFFFIYLWMREQICTVVCPYGRMQGVLLDKNSIVVAYDYKRGEPRAHINKKEARTAGDCIDCMQCVKVCPTGIDIRNGTQLECTNCTACIDACNKMMSAINFPNGLIRYASDNNISTKQPMTFTWRMKAYSIVMCVLIGLLVFLLASRTDVDVSFLRTRGQLYQIQPNHQISNLYDYKTLNKTFDDKKLSFKLENIKGKIVLVGNQNLKVPKDGFSSGSMFIFLDSTDVTKRKNLIQIAVYEGDKKLNN